MVLEVLANLYYYIFFVTRYLIVLDSHVSGNKISYFPGIVIFFHHIHPFESHVNFHSMPLI